MWKFFQTTELNIFVTDDADLNKASDSNWKAKLYQVASGFALNNFKSGQEYFKII